MTSWAHETTHYDLHVSLGTVLVEAVALIPKLTHLFMAEGGWLVAELTVAALLAGGVVEEVAVLKVAWQIHNLRVALLPLLHSRCNGVRVYSLQVDRVENLAFFVGAMTFGGGWVQWGPKNFNFSIEAGGECPEKSLKSTEQLFKVPESPQCSN